MQPILIDARDGEQRHLSEVIRDMRREPDVLRIRYRHLVDANAGVLGTRSDSRDRDRRGELGNSKQMRSGVQADERHSAAVRAILVEMKGELRIQIVVRLPLQLGPDAARSIVIDLAAARESC